MEGEREFFTDKNDGFSCGPCDTKCPPWMESLPFCWTRTTGGVFTDNFLVDVQTGTILKVFNSSFEFDLIGCNFYDFTDNPSGIKERLKELHENEKSVGFAVNLEIGEQKQTYIFQGLRSSTPPAAVLLGFETNKRKALKESIESSVARKTRHESSLRKLREDQLFENHCNSSVLEYVQWRTDWIMKCAQQSIIYFEMLSGFVKGDSGAESTLKKIRALFEKMLKGLEDEEDFVNTHIHASSKPVVVDHILQEGASLLCRRIPDHLEFRTELQSIGSIFGINPALLFMAIDDIVKIAIEALSNAEYGEIVIKTRDGADGNWIYVSIEDSAPVCPKENVFDPVFAGKGLMGMSLAAFKQRLNETGGDIKHFPRKKEPGNRYIIKLKRLKDDAGAKVIKLATGTTKGEKILIIHRNMDLMEAECRLLQRYGYNAVGVQFAFEGMKKLEDEKFDLVGVNIDRFRVDEGMAVLDTIRDTFPDLPVIVAASAGAFSELKERKFRNESVKEYIRVPYKSSLLLSKLNRIFSDTKK